MAGGGLFSSAKRVANLCLGNRIDRAAIGAARSGAYFAAALIGSPKITQRLPSKRAVRKVENVA